jgi:membrane protein DedA with SNARE-associated domain
MSGIESFLSEHGLLALFLIATLEGDLSMLVAGVLAHVGILPLTGAILAGALGNLAGDSVWFMVGHRNSRRIRASRLYGAVGPRVERLANKLGPWQLLAARVVYGTRNVSMLFWGQLRLPTLKFLLIDSLGCALAAAGFTLLGFAVGQSTAALTGAVRRVEHWLLVAVVVGGMLVWGVSRLARRELGD